MPRAQAGQRYFPFLQTGYAAHCAGFGEQHAFACIPDANQNTLCGAWADESFGGTTFLNLYALRGSMCFPGGAWGGAFSVFAGHDLE